VNPVRPSVWPAVQPPANGAGGAKSAAQRAFFDAALGKATGAPVPVPAPEVRSAPVQAQPVQRIPVSQPTEQPTKILRPGSLLDIRV
jgi:hypothetical protein